MGRLLEWLRMRLKVVFEPSDEGGYTVYVPSLPGCISEGDTLEEARENIREAIELYLEPSDDVTVPEGGAIEELAVRTEAATSRAAITRTSPSSECWRPSLADRNASC
jgi:predicted RNase H-like HicB family nuclease